MATSSADVPGKYDVVISDGTTTQGLVFLDSFQNDANAPEKAVHSFSSAFIPRTNIEGNYGDDKTEFFMTFSQKDWSLGEDQKYARADDSTSRRYWRGTAVDVRTPGEVRIRKALTTVDSDSGNTLQVGLAPETGNDFWYWVDDNTSPEIFQYDVSGNNETQPATVALTLPSSLAFDGDNLYIGGTDDNNGEGAKGVLRWDFAASAAVSFSATGSDALSYLNNALYGYNNLTGALLRYSTAGAATTLHTWRDAVGTAITGRAAYGYHLEPLGGKLLIAFGKKNTVRGSELWTYDGVGVSLLHQWSSGFDISGITTLNGIVYLAGEEDQRTTVYYYANGQVGVLWKSRSPIEFITSLSPARPQIATFGSGIVFTDQIDGASTTRVLYHDPSSGGIITLADVSLVSDGTGDVLLYANSYGWFLLKQNTDDIVAYRHRDAAVATTATVTSSLIDFDSSLQKFVRGIKVDYDEGSGGDGGSVDIAYRINDLDSTYTSLQTGAVAGTEYTLGTAAAPIKGRSISVRITLNKGTSTLGPILKRVYIRAAPFVNTFHRSSAYLDCTGADGNDHVELRDGTYEPKDGLALAHMLKEFAEHDGLLEITDKFGTRTSTMELTELIEVRPNEFVARVVFREV